MPPGVRAVPEKNESPPRPLAVHSRQGNGTAPGGVHARIRVPRNNAPRADPALSPDAACIPRRVLNICGRTTHCPRTLGPGAAGIGPWTQLFGDYGKPAAWPWQSIHRRKKTTGWHLWSGGVLRNGFLTPAGRRRQAQKAPVGRCRVACTPRTARETEATRASRLKPDRAGSGRIKPDRTGPGRIGPDRAGLVGTSPRGPCGPRRSAWGRMGSFRRACPVRTPLRNAMNDGTHAPMNAPARCAFSGA